MSTDPLDQLPSPADAASPAPGFVRDLRARLVDELGLGELGHSRQAGVAVDFPLPGRTDRREEVSHLFPRERHGNPP